MLKWIHIFAVFCALFMCGCVTTYTGTITRFPERKTFEPIPDAVLKLEMVGKRELISGIDDSITLRLTNKGKYIRIPFASGKKQLSYQRKGRSYHRTKGDSDRKSGTLRSGRNSGISFKRTYECNPRKDCGML